MPWEGSRDAEEWGTAARHIVQLTFKLNSVVKYTLNKNINRSREKNLFCGLFAVIQSILVGAVNRLEQRHIQCIRLQQIVFFIQA
jgi:hypothetical protein